MLAIAEIAWGWLTKLQTKRLILAGFNELSVAP
jgi:hypothetical protein